LIALLFALSITVASGLLAVTSRNIVYAIIALLSTNVWLGVAYYLVGAPTVALFQLAIFAGAVVVFFVVTVMLTPGGDTDFQSLPWVNNKVQAALAIIFMELLIGGAFIWDPDFPVKELSLTSGPSFVPNTYREITAQVSRFLWQHRALDLVSQSFVVLVAIICCVALLKTREEGE